MPLRKGRENVREMHGRTQTKRGVSAQEARSRLQTNYNVQGSGLKEARRNLEGRAEPPAPGKDVSRAQA